MRTKINKRFFLHMNNILLEILPCRSALLQMDLHQSYVISSNTRNETGCTCFNLSLIKTGNVRQRELFNLLFFVQLFSFDGHTKGTLMSTHVEVWLLSVKKNCAVWNRERLINWSLSVPRCIVWNFSFTHKIIFVMNGYAVLAKYQSRISKQLSNSMKSKNLWNWCIFREKKIL